MMNFVCIKWGDKYTPDYVNNLFRMVQKNYTKPFTFTCYTDDTEGLECDTHPIPDDGILILIIGSAKKDTVGTVLSFSCSTQKNGLAMKASGVTLT